MKKFIIYILCFYSSQVLSQSLTVEQISTDIDTLISELSDIHPTFNGPSNKQALPAIRDKYLEYTVGFIKTQERN